MDTITLLKGVKDFEIFGDFPKAVSGIFDEYDKVIKDCLFFAVKGNKFNGENYANEAICRGATVIVSERKLNLPVCNIVVGDIKREMPIICSNFYDNPEKKIKIIGLVGTNGKTSICHLIKDVLTFSGKKCATIGTLGVFMDGKYFPSDLTTVKTIDFYKILSELIEKQYEYLTVEVSAHAISQNRLGEIKYRQLIFTNCTEDHLDYFKDFGAYSNVKKSIFENKNAEYFVVNSDDSIGVEIIGKRLENLYTYGINNPSDVFAINVKENDKGISYVINLFDVIYDVNLSLLGKFNVYNTLAVATSLTIENIPIHLISAGLKRCKAIEGRLELVYNGNGKTVFVDYAHTPDGLKTMLCSLKKICLGKLYCVFGCGGDREKEKRPIMGSISGAIADFTVLTNDNPRFEDENEILSEIEDGLKKVSRNYIVIPDRKSAIVYAFNKMDDNDILVIAGKGAEKYQEIRGVKYEFNDKDVLLKTVN